MGTAHRFAVDIHHLSGQQLCQPLAPLYETLLELLQVQTGENVAEAVVGCNAIGQVQKGTEPAILTLTERVHPHPRVCPANDNGDDAQELVALAALDPWVFQILKVVQSRCDLTP